MPPPSAAPSKANLLAWACRRLAPLAFLVLLVCCLVDWRTPLEALSGGSGRSASMLVGRKAERRFPSKVTLPAESVPRVRSRSDVLYYNAIHKTGSTTMGRLLREQEKKSMAARKRKLKSYKS